MAGAGKSFFVKLMAMRNLLAGVDFLIIDPENEYRAVCEAVEGQYIRLASSSAHRLNPFDLPPADLNDGVDSLAEHVTGLLGLLSIMLADPGGSLDKLERAALDDATYQTYARAGITHDPRSHTRVPPTLSDLHAVLTDSGTPVA